MKFKIAVKVRGHPVGCLQDIVNMPSFVSAETQLKHPQRYQDPMLYRPDESGTLWPPRVHPDDDSRH